MEPEIVISGIGSCISQTCNVNEFKEYILNNAHSLGPARWAEGELNVCSKVHKMTVDDLFDATFFSMHRKQAAVTSINQKMILERSFEALVDAGVNPSEIFGKSVGVFVSNEFNEENCSLFGNESGFTLTGQVNALISNRVSYFLNINGPSYSVYSSWNGGIEVLQHAVDAIRSGQCESALVGTCNVSLTSAVSYAMDQLGILAPDGITNAFDITANGYARGDAIVVLYIQRADMAKRHYATILHASLSFNGNRSDGTFVKTAKGFTDFLTECYATSGINPNDVEYVETYGCGVKSTDELEMCAIDEVFCKNRKNPLYVGNVKSNVGHTATSADFVSIVKVLVAMESGVIPATLHYKTPNPNIPALTNGKVQIITKNKEWNGGIAAINSMGYTSSYGHIILRSNPVKNIAYSITIPMLTAFSSRTEEGINSNVDSIKTQSNTDLEYTNLVHNLYAHNIAGHLYRGYTIRGTDFKAVTEACSGDKKPIWFIYSGMGSQWHTMGRDLMVLPVFAEAIQKCHAILETKNMNLLKIISADDPKIFDNILNSFVGISAIQIALTDLLRSLDIVPAGIIGHSVGELGCAYADECLTIEQVVLGAYYRGIASSEADLQVGMMAAIGLGAQKIKTLCPPEIDIACHNSANSCTLSGPVKDMETFVNRLQQMGTFARLVNVSNIAYHSRYIQPAGPLLLKYLKELIKNPKLRTDRWISTSVPDSQWDMDLAKTGSAEYFTNNLLSAVLFEEHSKYIPDNAIAIEIAPHGILQAILTRSLEGVINIPLTKRNTNGIDFLLNALGKLYLSGGNFNLSALYPSISYPVSRGVKSIADLVQWHHEEHWESLGLTKVVSQQFQTYPISLNDEQYSYTLDMQINNEYILSPSLYLSLVYQLLKVSRLVENITFENVTFHKYLHYTLQDNVLLEVYIHKGSGRFEITIASDVLVTGYANIKFIEINLQEDDTSTQNAIETTDFYKEFSDRGYNLTGSFRTVNKISITENGIDGLVEWKNDWKLLFEAMLQIYFFNSNQLQQNMLMPDFIRCLSISLTKLPQEVTDLKVKLCTKNNIISTSCVTLWDVQFRPMTLEMKNIKVDCVKKIINTNIQTKTQNIVTNNYKIIKITTKIFCFDDLINKSNRWAIELSSILLNENSKSNEKIFIAARNLPTEGINNFINKLQEYAKNDHLRFVFNFDTESSEFMDNDCYHHIFEKDVLLSIFQNGKWEYHVTVNDSFVTNYNKTVETVLLSTLSSDFSNSCKVTYVGVNSKELTQHAKSDQFEIGHLDYAGIGPSNKKIMGLARTDLITCEAKPDPQFSWPVPENWTLSDAATIPYAYLTAYYVLFEKSNLKMGQSVLIHAGYTAFGIAVIRVATAHKCVIYTSVACEEQRQQLTTLFPQLPDDHILDLKTTDFEWKLLRKRNGKGIDLIINCLPGERIDASKGCADFFCTFIQLGVSQDDEHFGITSSAFLKNLMFYGVSLWRIVELDEEIKLRLHGYVADGIRQNIVTPITKTIFNMDEIDYLTSYLQSIEQNGAAILKMMNESSLSRKTLYRCDKNGIYIIYGGNPSSWINLVEWLTKRGAKTLLIVTKSQQNPNYINRRLTLINRAYNTNIIVTMESAQTISDLLTSAATLGLIKEIFVLGSDFETVNKTVHAINSVTKNQKIVCLLLENSTGAFYVSDNIITIKWESERTFMDVLNILDEILQSSGLDFVLKNDTMLLQHKHEENDLVTFYPRYLKDIKLIGRNMPKTSTFIKLQSTCSMNVINVPPVFLIPGTSGFNCSHIKHFAKKIMSPIYGIQITTDDLNTNYASTISQQMLKNHTSNFYNLIGVSFGGLLALEIAKCLETYGVQVQLTLIDGSPGTINKFTKLLNTNDDFKKTLLSQLHISNDDTVELDKGISILKAYTEYSNLYQPQNKLLSGDTYILQSKISGFDGVGIAQYCKNAISKMIDGDHRTMLEDQKLIDFINEHIEYLE